MIDSEKRGTFLIDDRMPVWPFIYQSVCTSVKHVDQNKTLHQCSLQVRQTVYVSGISIYDTIFQDGVF